MRDESFIVIYSVVSLVIHAVELERLAVYLDSDISSWYVDKSWEDLLPSEWGQIFKFGAKDGKPTAGTLEKHSYVL
ncbi:vacuolar sorting-associated 13B [Olea europaea subsp. europaea]|uniref:Vacuolar sorting-associated 13B n=1 Tax=Olea europaea subsp. europaea TaxID=158383 RepID=A0A8S0QXF4_OLEEU|nr:vacuolar sorting-associated 13B [Olea europaea subsp. europaea]